MNSQEILYALREGRITLEDAKKELAVNAEKISDTGSMSRVVPDTDKEYRSGTSAGREAVAIIGMSGRYPGAGELTKYWDNLTHGYDSIKEIPKSRWDVERYYDPRQGQEGKIYCKWLGQLEDIDCFDPLFFSISPTEAELMDPQQRIFLQEAYKAFEDAGYSSKSLSSGKCGVYLGIMSNEYAMMLNRNQTKEVSITGTSQAIAAARISYFLNLKGPAISIDTACSSSLVAVHLACQALLNREIDIGLAGGVTLYLTPESYVSMCSAGMLSPEGRCKTFDNGADGFVPGEGAGALVLKRLEDAEADNDFIYGVIIGSGINQDGKTNGITAPSVNSQMDLEREVYDKFNILPESVGYVEMHGTGTKLGDPIELEALSTVFKERTDKRNYCAIGSVKSNIGHTSAAAGVAGLQKVLLCLKHKKLVPTLNFRKHNEHFDFSISPFYVNTGLKPWEAAEGTPRRAGISSFGFSGTNAHMVIEEYIPETRKYNAPGVHTGKPALFVLSAKNKEQLKVYARSIKNYIESHSQQDIEDVAYTLQVGRDAMECRLAFVIDSRAVLIKALEDFINNNLSTEVFTGEVKGLKDTAMAFAEDNGTEAGLQNRIEKRELWKIAELWVKGFNIDWGGLYKDAKPRRISLPSYPFARERYWFKPESKPDSRELPVYKHPLLHENTSSLTEQRFTSTFTGEEFFLAGHVVKGQKVLPGAACLEMARAAVERSIPAIKDGEEMIGLKNVVWAKPLVVGKEPVKVHIALFPGDRGEIEYEIISAKEDHDISYLVFSQGTAVLSCRPENTILNLETLKAQCSNGVLTSEQCYELFKAMGVDYGPEYQGIEQVYLGTGQVLAKLSLPYSARGTREQFILHPSLTDSALQASIGLLLDGVTHISGDDVLNKPLLPFSLDTLEIFDQDTSPSWAFIRYSSGNKAGEKVKKLDIDLFGEEGRVCVRMRGFSTRLLDKASKQGTGPETLLPAGELGSETLEKPSDMLKSSAGEGIEEDVFGEKAVNYFKKLLSEVIKLPPDRIEADVQMEKYGIDSIMAMQLTGQLEKVFGPLPKTLFFEYQNIRELTEYFMESYGEQLSGLLRMGKKEEDTNASAAFVHAEEQVKPVSSRKRTRFSSFNTGTYKENGEGPLDIAVIGVSGRYPGAANIDEFWRNLKDGRDCITEIPGERWDYRLYFDEDKNKPGKTYSKWGGFLDGVDLFDPLFFNISPREAEIMEPQERLFLECAYEALEDAGYAREIPGANNQGRDVGVYAGVMYEEYQLYGAQETTRGRPMALFGNPSSIANRVSYFFNFHGPSMAVDTMCSSSLTAIYLACQSLQRGVCSMALAGGVNVSIHPNKYLLLGQGKFVSGKGRCESFGHGGDGYVPGEGVGAVILKKLSEAVADGDHIYGVIKGAAVNHGGKTNGYTVPNPNAQARVIGQAFKEAGINPRSVSYLEAHGTGTALGDPIEIAGLAKIFGEYTKDKQFCAIGSVKSNIGHCESAAGIAGLTKILLQLKYGNLVPSLHSEELNPNIDFPKTPFVVQQGLSEWRRPVVEIGGETKEYPRTAGISSFGAGGSNAHIVIEEYIPAYREQPQLPISAENPAVIVLSAKNEEQLREQARRMLAALRDPRFKDTDMADVAYTLQVGREAMEERLGVLADSRLELEEKLEHFIENRDNIEKLYRGQAKSYKDALAVFAADEDMEKIIETWINKRKYTKLLELWVRGLNIDWNRLYRDKKTSRVSLPTYPFARERYWAPGNSAEFADSKALSAVSTAIHPLLHRNTSDINGLKFSSVFTGQEFFLTDHRVNGKMILPGAACLEMVRAAVEQAVGNDYTRIQLKNVVWVHPVVVKDLPVQVHIGLFPGNNGEIAYEIYSIQETENAEPVIHSRGSVVQVKDVEAPTLDIKALQVRCEQRVFSSDQCYEAFKTVGIEYGPGHMGLDRVYVGADQLLARLMTPVSVSGTAKQFVLHPGLTDSAFQASVGFMLASDRLEPALPFAIQRFDILSDSVFPEWVVIRYSDGCQTGGKVQKLDMDLCDGQGKVCARIRGFSTRMNENAESVVKPNSTAGTVMLEPLWKEQEVERSLSSVEYASHLVVLCEPEETLHKNIKDRMNGVCCVTLQAGQKSVAERFQVYSLQIFEKIKEILKSKIKGSVIVQVLVQTEGETQLFSGLSGLLKTARLENPKLIGQLIEVTPGIEAGKAVEILEENRRSPIDIKIRYRDGKRYISGWGEVEASLREAGLPWKNGGVYLITGGAGGLGLIFAERIANSGREPVLVLTGRSDLDEVKQARLKKLQNSGARVEYRQVDVTDNKAVSDMIQSIQEEFGALNGIIHSAGVISDSFILRKADIEFETVLAPKVSGLTNLDEASKGMPLDFFVLFSSLAGALGNPGQADYSTANAYMDAYAEYRNQLAADGLRHGKTVSINWPLWQDGGMQVEGEIGKLMLQNMGLIAMQTSTGVRALYQALASGRNQVLVLEGDLSAIRQKLCPEICGSALRPEISILELDAVVETGTDTLFDKVQGVLIQTISQILNVDAFDVDADAGLEEYGLDQVALSQICSRLNHEYKLELTPSEFLEHSNLNRIAKYLLSKHRDEFLKRFPAEASGAWSGIPDTGTGTVTRQDVLAGKAVEYFKKQLSNIIKLPAHRIEADVALEKYGMDSVMALQLTSELEKAFGPLSKTLLFEYQSIGELTVYFLSSYRQQLAGILGIQEKAPAAVIPQDADIPAGLTNTAVEDSKPSSFSSFWNRNREGKDKNGNDIAVIGISGRYPGAGNLREFWRNLMEGRDCITEIPEERWNYGLYFDTDKDEPGKAYSKWGGFLKGVDLFDPLFFNISPREAELMDPQERLFLECVYETLESAGYTPKTLQHLYKGRVGVYAGAMSLQYNLFESDIEREAAVALASYGSIANRVSHFFNFQGPSIAVDTMCSSSAVAIHMACESLMKEECRIAVAGGVNLTIHPKKYLGLSRTQMLGSNAGSRSFGDGDGYIPSEGIGTVLLKPLDQAIDDRDSILAVIKSTAVNHAGHTNGFFVPNPNAQAQLFEESFSKAGIDPRTISYVEAAANGSALGDAIEISALSKAFGKFTEDKQFCAIGSVKSNIGHAEAASGISQLTKVILQLKHKQLVPSIKAEPLNPNLRFHDTPFYLQQKCCEWKRPTVRVNGEEREFPRRAAINSFGAGGSNAHLIVEEYIPSHEAAVHAISTNKPRIAVFSARTPERLEAVVRQMLNYVKLQEDLSLPDLIYTLQTGREAMECRMAAVVKNGQELIECMEFYLKSEHEDRETKTSIPVFTGNLYEKDWEIKSFLTGKVGEAVLRALIEENNLEKLALHWVKGGDAPWDSFYREENVRRISLPAYPFAKERYWISDGSKGQSLQPQIQLPAEKTQSFEIIGKKPTREIVRDYIAQFLSLELGLSQDKIKFSKDVRDYGVNSIAVMRIMRSLEKNFHIKVTGREMLEYSTVESLASHIYEKIIGLGCAEDKPAGNSLQGKKAGEIREYMDEQVIAALEKYEQGDLNLKEIQNLIGRGE